MEVDEDDERLPFKKLHDWTLTPTRATTIVPGARFQLVVRQQGGPGSVRSGVQEWEGQGMPMFRGFEPLVSVPPGQIEALVEFVVVDDAGREYRGVQSWETIEEGSPPVNTVRLAASNGARQRTWAKLIFASDVADHALMREARVLSLLVGADMTNRGRALQGPQNDVELMRFIIDNNFPTRPGDGATLLGLDATLQAITDRLESMARTAQRGDVVFIYFSGLGTTRREPAQGIPALGIQPRPTACLVPFDVYPTDGGHEYNLLSAVDVARMLNPAMQKGATVVLVLDCSFCKDPSLELHISDPHATVKYLELTCSLLPGEAQGNVDAINSFESVVDTVNVANRGPTKLAMRSGGTGELPAEGACVGSVLDTLLVGAQQSAGAATGECGRWGVIARGAQGFGAGIVEAASKATATRDVGAGERKAALDALGAVTGKQWAAVAAKAIALDPRGMRALVDRATGGLGASDSRRRQLLRLMSDSALVRSLADALQSAPTAGQHSAEWQSLLMGAGGDREKLHEAVQELPLQKKMELLEEAGQEMGEVEARPWVCVLSAMLAEAPDATRAAVNAEVVRYGLGDSRLRGMLEDIGARKSVLDVLASLADECRSVLSTVAAKLGMQSGTLGDLLATARDLMELVAQGIKTLPHILLPLISSWLNYEIMMAPVFHAPSDIVPSSQPDTQMERSWRNTGGAAKTEKGWTILGVWDSPVSFRAILLDSALAGHLKDPQIEVVQRSSARAPASGSSLVPTDGNLCGLDSVHAFATVRAVLDAAERVLRRIVGAGCKEDLWQELPEPLDDGLWGGDGGADRGLRWQVGKTLRVDTRAAGVLEPLYSRSAGGLLFPASGTEGGGVEAAPASRGVEVVAHTAGYALLDALRPEWAEGVRERPEGGVLHEALGDLVALLVPLGSPAVGGAVAAQTRCDVRAAGVAKRMARALADAVGGSAVRSASSTLTARDVWDVATGQMKKTGSGRLWSSRELSGMITSAVYGAVASELLRRCHGSGTAGRGGKESAKCGGAAEDPAEVLSQLAKQALRVLIEACLEQSKDKAAPTLVEFCESLVKGMQSHEGDALALLPGSVEHTTATLQRSTTNKLQLSALMEKPTRAGTVSANGPAVRMCECIARVGAEAATAVECTASRELWAMVCSGAREALALAGGDDVAAWERLEGTWGAMERRAAGQRDFVDKRMWRAIVVEAAEEPTAEGCKASVEKMVLSLEYVTGC
eukprot:m51a1_g10566 hypothetical protein (1225) ;mRNA; f:28069-33862